MRSVILRPFTAEDAPKALELCRALHAESSLADIPFSPPRVLNLFARALAEPDEVFFYVAEQDESLVGSFYGNLLPYFGCEGHLATEKWVHVLPEFRGTGAATSLVKRFLRWADEMGAIEVLISPSTGIQTERTARWLESLRFHRAGVIMKRRL